MTLWFKLFLGNKKKLTLIVGLLLTVNTGVAISQTLEPRAMSRYHKLGLRFDVYNNPLWEPKVDRSGIMPSIVIAAPDNYFPPAEFVITPFPNITVTQNEIFEFSVEAIKNAKKKYGRRPTVNKKYIQPRFRGEFSGYEIEFEAKIDGIPMSVLFFTGRHKSDGRVISMTATTLSGRLPQIKEHVRRTFDWVFYLK